MSSTKIKEALLKTLDEKKTNVSSLEKEIGVQKNVLRNIINGQSSNPSIDTCIAIAKALDCSLDELAGLKEFRHQYKIVSSRNTSFSKKVFNEIIVVILAYIEEKDYFPSFEDILYFINESYLYSVLENSGQPDIKFIKWTIDRKMLEFFN